MGSDSLGTNGSKGNPGFSNSLLLGVPRWPWGDQLSQQYCRQSCDVSVAGVRNEDLDYTCKGGLGLEGFML